MVSAPDWLVSKVQAGHPPICADNPVAPLAAIPEGKRNATLASMGGAMRAVAFKEAEVRGALLAVNTDRCAPPLSDVEVAGIAASVANYAPSVPRAGGVFLPRDLIRQRDLWGRLIEWRMLQWLIAEATWTEEERGTCRLEVGQVLTSCRKIATACSWSENNVVHLWKPTQVKRALASLVKAGRIQVLVTGPGTLVTVLDYQQYQGFPLGRGGGLVRGLETA